MTRSQTDYFEERIKGITTLINAQFLNLQDCLKDIKKDSDSFRKDIDSLKESLFEVKIDEKTHTLNCPVLSKIEEKIIPEIDKINKDLEEYRMIKRYPKLTIFLLIIISFISVFNIIEFQSKSNSYMRKNNDLEIIGRKYNELINSIDSLKIRL